MSSWLTARRCCSRRSTEEADQLADRIVVIDRGRIIAEGTPLEPATSPAGCAFVVTVSRADQLEAARGLLATHVREVHVDEGARQPTAPADGLADVTRIASVFDGSEIVLDDLGLSARASTTSSAPDGSPGRGRRHR